MDARRIPVDPGHEAMLAWELRQSEEALRDEELLVAQSGAPTRHRVPLGMDRQAAIRAGAAFGLKGGELCGCHEQGCDTCASNRGCGRDGCGVCESYGWQERSRGPKRKPEGLGPLPDGSDEEAALVDFSAGAMLPIFDAHSHLFAPNRYPLRSRMSTSEQIDTRAGWLIKAKHYGVKRMVISGMPESDRPSALAGAELDDAVEQAVALDPDYFVPFARGFNWADLSTHVHHFDEDSADYVRAWLDKGYLGIGEIFVHGHSADADDLTELVEVCQVAADKGVPVQVYWEIGNVDVDPAGVWVATTADFNFRQLKMLLGGVPPGRRGELKLILAHCGIGPFTTDRTVLNAWQARMTELLVDYPNVYFDVAGTLSQLASPTPYLEANPDGAFILQQMKDYRGRFMVGLDTETKRWAGYTLNPNDPQSYQKGALDWIATAPDYVTFLHCAHADQIGFTQVDRAEILYGNASALLGVP